jgi:hypothetical protein
MKNHKVTHFGSIACLLHCILTPLVIIVSPFIGHFLENLIVEISLLILSILCGIFIVYNGYCIHKKKHCILLFSTGAFLWIIHSLFEFKEIFGAKIYFTIGTIFVLASYYINHRLIKCCPTDCCER